MAINNLTQQGRASTAVEISAGGTATQSVIELDEYPNHKVFEASVSLIAVDNIQVVSPAIHRVYSFIKATTIDHIMIDFGGLNQTSGENLTVGLWKSPGAVDGSAVLAVNDPVGSFVVTEGSNDSGTAYFVDLSGTPEDTRRFNPGESLWVSFTVQTNDDDLGDVGVTILGRNFQDG